MSATPSHPSQRHRPLLIAIIVFCVFCIVGFLAILFMAAIIMDDPIPNPMLDTAAELGGASRSEVQAAFGQPDRVIGSSALLDLEPAQSLLAGFSPIPLRVFDTLEVYRLPATVSDADQVSDQASDGDGDLPAVVFYYDSSGVVFLVVITDPAPEYAEKYGGDGIPSPRKKSNIYY